MLPLFLCRNANLIDYSSNIGGTYLSLTTLIATQTSTTWNCNGNHCAITQLYNRDRVLQNFDAGFYIRCHLTTLIFGNTFCLRTKRLSNLKMAFEVLIVLMCPSVLPMLISVPSRVKTNTQTNTHKHIERTVELFIKTL